MRRALAFVLSLLPALAGAQTPVPITPGAPLVLVWDMEALSATVAAPDTVRLCVDAICTPITATYAPTMSAPIPAMTPGVHTLRVQSCKTYPAPRGEECKEASLAVEMQVVTSPAQPSNLRLGTAPTPPGEGGDMPTARVQKSTLGHGTDTITFPGSVTAGNAIVLFASRYQADINAADINSALGLTYTLLVHLQRGGSSDERVALFVALNISGGEETISLDAHGNGTTLVAAEYSGVLTADALDDTSSQSGSGTPSSGDATSSTSDAIAVGAFTHADGTTDFAPGAGWTEVDEEIDNVANQALGAIDRVLTGSGDYNATWTGSFSYAAAIAILKANGGGGTTLAANANSITLTPPLATAVPGASTQVVGLNGLTVTASSATLIPDQFAGAGANAMAVTASPAALVPGVSTLGSGANPITLTASPATIAGALQTLTPGAAALFLAAPAVTLLVDAPVDPAMLRRQGFVFGGRRGDVVSGGGIRGASIVPGGTRRGL